MTLGYDGKLYILAFDHRGSFQKKMFGIEGDPSAEQTETIADAKHLIFEGMLKAVDERRGAGRDRRARGRAVRRAQEHPRRDAKERGLMLAMPVEKSGQNEFDFEYGDDFGAHIEQFDPDFSKVLVRYNPDGDAEMNERQTERLKRLADWLHENDRKFLFELLVPAEDAPARAGRRRHRPLRRRAAPRADAPHDRASSRTPASRRTSGRSRASTRRRTARRSRETCRRDGRDGVVCVVLGRGADDDEGRPLAAPGRPRRGLRRLRHRPHDLVGRAQGLPRRRPRARGRRGSRSPTTTCASCKVYDEAARADCGRVSVLRERAQEGSSARITLVAFRARHADAAVTRAVRGGLPRGGRRVDRAPGAAAQAGRPALARAPRGARPQAGQAALRRASR